jgi:hypothetical protein
MPGAERAATDPEDLIEITGGDGRYCSGYYEWNGQRYECAGHDHLTRADALTCAEDRLRFRS